MSAEESAGGLQLIFQASVRRVLPDDWKKAHIMPIFKKCDKVNPANYWPISLTSIILLHMEVLHV